MFQDSAHERQLRWRMCLRQASFSQVLRPAGDAADKVPHAFEIKAAPDFPLDYLTNQGGLGPFLGGGAASQRFAMGFGKTDGEGGFHKRRLGRVRRIARQES